LIVAAQMPTLQSEGSNVYLQKLDVEVSINGMVATTVWTMTFANPTKRILEGELNFPLPQGVSVSRYALDINGRLREAVPVEKAKATEVFENTERRRVDPGLLEKVAGNTFRTRIYPINAGGTRIVRIGYDQQLSWEGEADLQYRLPLAFKKSIGDFSIRITVGGTATKPQFSENTTDALQFDEWQHSWTAKKEWKDYAADKPIAIRIPQLPGSGAIQMHAVGNHYFFTASVFPKPQHIEKSLPKSIGLMWDVSLSGLSRDHTKEFALLDAWFSTIGNVEVSLVEFSNTVSGVQHFSIHGGDWRELRKTLENAVYDGATQFGVLKLTDYPVDEFVLVSDGHSDFGSDRAAIGDKPVYAINTSARADIPYLQSITESSGGELINLTEISVAKGKDLLGTQTLHFLGVKAAEGIEECYPSVPTPVIGGLMIAGMVYQPTKNIVLQFGYGKKVIKEESVSLDAGRQSTTVDLGKIWAQKKIAELDTRYEDNQLEIRHLGRSYGIATRNTSLIVLENIQDYITYQIEPPAYLRQEYDRLMKSRPDLAITRRQVTDNAEQYFNELLSWWKGNLPKVEKEKTEGRGLFTTPRVARDEDAQQLSRPRANQAMDSNNDADGSSGLLAERSAPAPRSVGADQYLSNFSGPVSKTEKKTADKPATGAFTILKAEANAKYLDDLKATAKANRYAAYIQLRKEHLHVPLFYFHVAEFFLKTGEKATGIRILSNIAELDAENYELYKMMAYKLKEEGETGPARTAFRKVLDWRPFEPQSYRDYGLALEDAGQYQNALDTLYLALTKNYDATTSALYPGIEETLLPEINELITRHGGKLNVSKVPKQLVGAMPVDMRVVLNWNRASTDIDLWVTDPDNERCYYGHRFTEMGGRISHDFTQGLGPEQFLLKKAVKGRYKVEVNYYGDTQVRLAGETTLLVEVYTHYGTAQQQRSLVTLQMKPGASGGVYVGDFQF
jgi:Ca-activated chloride channel family protein